MKPTLARFIVLFLILPMCAQAADRFVRPSGGVYGTEDGTSFTNAWDGFNKINWSALGPGDTLYIVGNFNEGHLNVRAGGDATNDFFIRGDHAMGPGIINNGSIRWIASNNYYITVDSLTILNGHIVNAWPIPKYTTTMVKIISPDKLRDTSNGLIANGFLPGMLIQLFGGDQTNRKTFLISNITDEGSYEELTIDSSPEATNSFQNETPTYKTLEPFWPNHHITVQNCRISDNDGSLVSVRGTDMTIRNNELDSQNANEHGVLYFGSSGFWKRIQNLTVDGNYIHSVDSPLADRDAHCVGVQSGIDNLVFTRNHLKDCGAGIVVWNGTNSIEIGSYDISYNFIENMDFNRQPFQWGGSGIVFTGTGVIQPGVISHNVVINPLNCPQDPGNNVGCRGIRYNRNVQASIHNNTIDGYEWGIELKNGYNADVKNNVITNSILGHIKGHNTSLQLEDFQAYYPADTETLFRIDSTTYDFSGYNQYFFTNQELTLNASSITTDPNLDSLYAPNNASDPVVDVGTNMGKDYIQSVVWPNGPGGGSFVFGSDATNPDMGAIMLSDTDGDGVSETLETFIGTDPTNADSDGDNLSDGFELGFDGNPGSYNPTTDLNPLSADTDGDGFNDDIEISIGSDPLNVASIPATGDINGDGNVNTADVLLATRITLGLLTPSANQLVRGDVAPLNSGTPAPDGVINVTDTMLITRKALGYGSF